jgi:dTDP-4-amino-4,6-dideoxygalactose transaminase
MDFFWARNAIFHGLRALGIQPGQKILVPAYLCTAAIQPIEFFGAEVEFYAIGQDCVPCWRDLEARIRGNVRAVLAVHYFGFPCDMEKFCTLRDRYNLFLIEDCAHVLGGMANEHRFGEFGDFSVFSPRKYLPIFDGGRLRLNRPAPEFQVRFQFESPVFTFRVAKNLLERRKLLDGPLLSSAEPQPQEAVGERESSRDRGLPEKPRYVFPNSASFLPWMADFPMSRLSKHLLTHFPIESIASKRRANYDRLLEKLSGFRCVQPLFEHLAPGVVPWVLPVTIGQLPGAHTRLRALGIPAVTWDGVRDSRISAREFPDADFLYNHLVFLPIHQNLGAGDLDLIAAAVAKVCQDIP